MARRLVRWSISVSLWYLVAAWDHLRGRGSSRQRGVRLRQLLEWTGGAAVTIGQQIAMRIDMIPIEICEELSRLRDVGRPIDVAYAVERIERSIGRSMDDLFETFDPAPVASLTVSCIYQALRKNGRKSIIHVRRPGIGQILDADLRSLSVLLTVLEEMTIVRPGCFRRLREDLGDMILDELDFLERARLQTLFRRHARRDRLRYATAPRVRRRLSSEDVLINDFASGYYLAEVLDAKEKGDLVALARFAAEGIEPDVIARRILHVHWWGVFEALFFYADPHPSNIVIQPGGRLVFLDFSCCGSVSSRLRQLHLDFLNLLWEGQISRAVDCLIGLLTPLPFVDVHELSKKIELRLWHHHHAMRVGESAPWARTPAGAWISFLDVVREFGIHVHLETLRMIHTTLLYNTVAARLWDDIGRGAFRGYRKKAFRRGMRRVARERKKTKSVSSPIQRVDALGDRIDRMTAWMESAIAETPAQFLRMSGKWSYIGGAILRFVAQGLTLAVLGVVGVAAWYALRGQDIDAGAAARAVLGNPIYLAHLIVFLVIACRLILFRLEDMDPDD